MSKPSFPPAREISVETNFQKMACRPGGIARSEAIEAATAELKELSPEYRRWLAEETDGLAAAVDALLKASEVFSENLAVAEDHCRKIRDVAGTMNFDLVTFVTDNLSAILQASHHNMDSRRDPIECHISSLRLVSRDEYEGKTANELPHFTEGLRKVAESVSACHNCLLSAKAANQNNSSSES